MSLKPLIPVADRLAALQQILQRQADASGFIPFEAWMHTTLYAPGLGYYAATQPLGTLAQGADFTTAPQISPLFGQTVAQALLPVFASGVAVQLLECGAGTGQWALDILTELREQGLEIVQYSILEVSTSLRKVQQETLRDFPQVRWLEAFPEHFEGVILGNELLDAMPVQAYELKQTGSRTEVLQRGVQWDANHQRWQWALRPCTPEQAAQALACLPEETALQEGYQFELGEQANAWVRLAANSLTKGVLLLVDYGFPQAELYHPQRTGGTLMAHYRHQASSNVLAMPGAADITVHVDFSAIAAQAQQAGLDCMGYTSQARFLMNAGIAQGYTARVEGLDIEQTAALAQGLQLLMSEAEMGELFKVIALGRGCLAPLGFEAGNRMHRL